MSPNRIATVSSIDRDVVDGEAGDPGRRVARRRRRARRRRDRGSRCPGSCSSWRASATRSWIGDGGVGPVLRPAGKSSFGISPRAIAQRANDRATYRSGARAGEPRVDVGLLAARRGAFGGSVSQSSSAAALRSSALATVDRAVVERCAVAGAPIAAQHDPVRERPQRRLVIAVTARNSSIQRSSRASAGISWRERAGGDEQMLEVAHSRSGSPAASSVSWLHGSSPLAIRARIGVAGLSASQRSVSFAERAA